MLAGAAISKKDAGLADPANQTAPANPLAAIDLESTVGG